MSKCALSLVAPALGRWLSSLLTGTCFGITTGSVETAMLAWFLHSSMGTSHSDAYESVVHVVLSSAEVARTLKVQVPDGSGDNHATPAYPCSYLSDCVAFPQNKVSAC